ncbi:unnamed protein product [Paramecium octaurelia]|uniref:Uncharacterized protein n=1 Tax=Paramecium octaurelia TaxID=43137 RepID=A0A8S1RYQ8_PAROT|nr:unnamed protein product [Paramecium octaurelia]
MQRQDSQKNQEMIVRFLNFCATLIQKNVKGYIQRQRHKIIMMHIRRFKAILNGFIQGYRTRQIFKVPDVAKLRQNIIETDDGTYGNPQIRQKKIRLIRMIENYLQNGQFYKKLKRVKSSQRQFVPNQYLDNEFVSQDQKFQQNYYKKPSKQPLQANKVEQQYYDQLIQNEYSEQPQPYYQEYMQQNSQIRDQSHSNSNLSGQYQQSQRIEYSQDERPIKSKNQTNFAMQERITPEKNSFDDDRPICGKGKYNYEEDERPINPKNATNYNNYVDDRPINAKNANTYNTYEDERPINAKNTNIYNNQEDERPIATKKANAYYEDDRPIAAKNKGTYNQYEDERPIKKGKDIYQFEQEQYLENDRPIANTGKYQQFEDERPLGGKGQYDLPADEIPISGKGTYGHFEEDAPPKKQKQPPRKKAEQKKENKQIEDRQQNLYDNQNENEPPLGKMQNDEFNDQEKPKPKKKDPKLLENLKKRTKYDPRKAIQEAKKKQEEQQQLEQVDVEEVAEQQEVQPQQQQQIPQKKQVLSQQNLQERQQSPKTSKLNLSATPEKQGPQVEQIGECSPKDDASDQKPKNFLKRKSKQIPLKNPKVDPKTVKSKVKNCWNAGNPMDDQEFDGNEDIPQSPKAYIINKSPSRRFEQKGSDQQLNYQQQQLQQQQLIQQQQQIQQNKSQGPLHVQVQLVQENVSQYQINPSHQANQQQQQKRQSIQLDELERAYYSKYTQKLETTKMNLKVLDQERQQNPGGVPIITTKSRFFTSFRVNDFERLLAQLEDQYNKLQISK